MIQTWALLVDAYRELNARKLFWISIGLSLLCAAILGCLGLTSKGVSVLWWELPVELFNTNFISKEVFYKFLFQWVGFYFWLSWASAILALISTASIIPDFVSSGAIELVLSKPISRLRLYLSKYLVGLFFVGLQVGIFSGAAFLVVGVRGGGWIIDFFWAVPITMLFFSYLFCVSSLVGLLTRSAIASVIVTALVWVAVFFVHQAETVFLHFNIRYALASDVSRADLETRREQLRSLGAKIAEAEPESPKPSEAPSPEADGGPAEPPADAAPPPNPPASPWPTIQDLLKAAAAPKDTAKAQRDLVEKLKSELADREIKNKEIEQTAADLRRYHAIVFGLKTVLPKTTETMLVLEHRLISSDERESLASATRPRGGGRGSFFVNGTQVSIKTLDAEQDKALRARSLSWVLGTSAAFEAVLLGISCIVFVRRDF